jgi:antitoxin component of MazEF toxin-antitoxin module
MVSTRRIEEWNDENDRTEMWNSLATWVPKRVADGAGLPEKDAVEIEVRRGRCIVQPHLRRVYRLEDVLKCIRPRHVREEVGFSEPFGR